MTAIPEARITYDLGHEMFFTGVTQIAVPFGAPGWVLSQAIDVAFEETDETDTGAPYPPRILDAMVDRDENRIVILIGGKRDV